MERVHEWYRGFTRKGPEKFRLWEDHDDDDGHDTMMVPSWCFIGDPLMVLPWSFGAVLCHFMVPLVSLPVSLVSLPVSPSLLRSRSRVRRWSFLPPLTAAYFRTTFLSLCLSDASGYLVELFSGTNKMSDKRPQTKFCSENLTLDKQVLIHGIRLESKTICND